jgi:hypothetical protein
MRILVVFLLILFMAITQFAIVPAWPSDRVGGWSAAAAIATMLTTLTAFAGLVGLLHLRSEARRARQQMRADIGPYLRVDLFVSAPGGTYAQPSPDSATYYSWDQFNPGASEPPTAVDPWRTGDGTPLLLRVENQQKHAAGIAHNLEIILEIYVPSANAPLDDDPVQHVQTVQFHYVEPGRSVGYEVARLDPQIPYITGRVQSITYHDLFGSTLHFAHGSGIVEVGGGVHVNSRKIFISQPEAL